MLKGGGRSLTGKGHCSKLLIKRNSKIASFFFSLLSIWYKFGNGMLMGSEDIDIAIHVGEVIDITVGSSIQI